MAEKFIKFLGVIGLIFLYPSNLNADLNGYTFKIIQTAFMNGCVYTLNSDLETIKYLKENPYELKRYVEVQAKIYMTKVSRLNSRGKNGTNRYSPGQGDVVSGSTSYTYYNH